MEMLKRQYSLKQVLIAEGGFAKHMSVCLLVRRKMPSRIRTARDIIIKQKANTSARRKGERKEAKREGVSQIDDANPKRKDVCTQTTC